MSADITVSAITTIYLLNMLFMFVKAAPLCRIVSIPGLEAFDNKSIMLEPIFLISRGCYMQRKILVDPSDCLSLS
jgi:hypothetical protein